MISIARRLPVLIAGLFFSAFPAASAAADQAGDEEIHQTVARISYISGEASYSRGDDPDNWQAADINVPMTLGDRVYTGEGGRVELQVHGGDSIRLDAGTDLAALNLTNDTKQFSLKQGLASFQVRRLKEDEVFEVDTPNAAITFEQPGEYRIHVDDDGNTRVAVRHGRILWAAGGGQITLNAGDEVDIDGIDSPRYEIVPVPEPDRFDRWVEEREQRLQRVRSSRYVSSDIVGVDDLDEHGRWEDIPEYGHVWTPSSVEVGWEPYRAGHWVWQDPWGWTWIAGEPWGWAPYHYGHWVYYSRWYWVPVAPAVSVVAYSPAMVAFVGGGPGWSVSVSGGGGGFVGWFPLAPSDPFVPWWGPRRTVNVTNVTYVNRTFVTVVNRNTFISGGVVTNHYIRDRAVLRQVARAPVARGPIPMVPTRASLRVSVRENARAPRPSAAIMARPVVARMAPPPAPPTFQAKLGVIRRSGGVPVSTVAAAGISAAQRGTPRAMTAVRPVARENGRVTLAPRGAKASAARPEPVAAVHGRPMATSAKPVASSPAAPSGRPAPAAPPRSGSQAGSKPEQPARAQPKNEDRRPKPVARPAHERERPAPQQGRQPERQAAPSARESKPPAERPQAAPAKEARPERQVERPSAGSRAVQPAQKREVKSPEKEKPKAKEKPKPKDEKKEDRSRQ
ncbi:MAG TPA: DUF6600 domain-containing protein [Thermoanaerobaculia bacterium]|nr:DUF6600 domain-containing protein [Thermoanaerobaculia bacterium]